MTKSTILRNAKIPTAPLIKKNIKPPKQNWNLYDDGLSYSLLSKFVVCRERFRLRTVEGLVNTDNKSSMDFGTIFHRALELSAQGVSTSRILAGIRKQTKEKSFDPVLCRIAAVMIPQYKEFWKHELNTIQYFETEQVFDFAYTSSLKVPIRLRGRRDEGFKKDGKIWLQENKTKGQIQEDQIVQTLGYMLQPMLYLLSFKNDHPGLPLGGILYNVIRKPQLVRGKKESENDFIKRIISDIEDRPEHYFKMFEVGIDDHHLEQWRIRYFDPIISQVILWWESIKHDPFNPWVGKDGLPNPHHSIRPFGIFDSMSQGIGDYFGRIVQGHDVGLVRDVNCFRELE
jgi:hypothetical protein